MDTKTERSASSTEGRPRPRLGVDSAIWLCFPGACRFVSLVVICSRRRFLTEGPVFAHRAFCVSGGESAALAASGCRSRLCADDFAQLAVGSLIACKKALEEALIIGAAFTFK